MSAVFSTDPEARYRYALVRDLGQDGPVTCFVMLNPSTADGTRDDATIRRCIGFATQWGSSKLIVANLFALRSTDPSKLYHAQDPVGPENDSWINDSSNATRDSGGKVIAAWGNHGIHAGRGWTVAHIWRAKA